MTAPTRLWPRAILHIDMNAFFASVEQRDFQELRGKPVGVTNGEVGTTLITCSYEARAAGVQTGIRVYDARQLCPGLIQYPARPKAYAAISTRIMHALQDISPDVEVFSVDEAFIDVTHCQRLHGSPEHIAQLARQCIHDISGGLPSSIGVAGTKSTAKIASDLKKPNGLTVIPPWEARSRLDSVPMKKLCGLGPNIAEFLSLYGAHTCGDVARLPLTVLARRYGVTGKYLWLACQGKTKRHPTVGDNVVIGAGAEVLGAITIGSNSRIGANAVVNKSTPPDSVVVGVPGQVVVRDHAVHMPNEKADLEHGSLPDTVGETLAALIAHVNSLEKRIGGHTHEPALHAPDHGVWHWGDFSI